MRSLQECRHLRLIVLPSANDFLLLNALAANKLLPLQAISDKYAKNDSDSIYATISKSWDSDSNKRPTISTVSFKMIFVKLLLYLPDISIYDSLFGKILFCLLAANNCNLQIFLLVVIAKCDICQ